MKHFIVKTTAAFACVVLFVLPQACKDKVVDDDPSVLDSIKAQTTPEAVLYNFKLAYNFAQNGMDVEAAIELYRDCFSNDANGPRYEFEYRNVTGGVGNANPDFMSFAEEMTSTAILFREVASMNLDLNLKEFRAVSSSIELAADTAVQEKKHPGEDWYVYEMNAYLTMENPNPAANLFLVQGNVVFSIRRCTDGKCRMVRWVDRTYESIYSAKTAEKQTVGKPYNNTSWGSIKSLYR